MQTAELKKTERLPLISIVVPAYNAEDTLSETLDAILAQTRQDWECVVVDDGSTDGTLELAREYEVRDNRFHVFTQENRGSGGAYNTGVKKSIAPNIALCSADDLLNSNWFSAMSNFLLSHSNYDIFCSNGEYLDHKTYQTKSVYARKPWLTSRELSLREVSQCCFFSVGAIYRKNWFEKVGGYREDVFGEDYDFWIRCMAQGAKTYYVSEFLSKHRLSEFQKTQLASEVAASSDEVINYALADTTIGRHERNMIKRGHKARLRERSRNRIVCKLRDALRG